MTARPTTDPAVVDNPELEQYEIRVDGELAGLATYRQRGDRTVFVHTEVDPAHQGEGLADRLIKAALADVRAQGRRIAATCPFVTAYLARHPDEGTDAARGAGTS